jgi:hypothetical protein
MAIVIATHKVKDFSTWKPFFDADARRRKEMRIKELKQGRKADDPNQVYFIWEIEDPAKLEAGLHDPELRAIMEKAGVIGDLNITVLNEF